MGRLPPLRRLLLALIAGVVSTSIGLALADAARKKAEDNEALYKEAAEKERQAKDAEKDARKTADENGQLAAEQRALALQTLHVMVDDIGKSLKDRPGMQDLRNKLLDTMVDGLIRHHKDGRGRFGLWLNASGAGAEAVEMRLRAAGVPLARSMPGALEQLPALLAAADVHLITLRSGFAGIVLPSKVYGCLESRKPILFIGSAKSDVHLLCGRTRARSYWRVDAGDALGFAETLEDLADHVEAKEQARKFAAGVT